MDKRFRHYNKDLAIVLSCFGSVVEQQKYIRLKEFVESKFEAADLFTAFQSRMVIKKLAKNGEEYKTLTQTLADVDALGYKRVVVVSINLFPTDEHQLVKRIADGFNTFSESYIKITDAIFNKTKYTTKALQAISDKFKSEDTANLFIIHGTPKLETIGTASIDYAGGFLSKIAKRNHFCSLEGAYPFHAVKDSIIEEIKDKGFKKVKVIPLLLVSGNHFDNDAVEIQEAMDGYFETSIAMDGGEKFALIEEDYILDIIVAEIKEEIKKTEINK